MTHESVSKVLGPGSRVESDAQVEVRYRQQVVSAYGHLTLHGYPEGGSGLSAPPLERIFVKLSTTTSRAPALDLPLSERIRDSRKLREGRRRGKGREIEGERLILEGRELTGEDAEERLRRYEQEMEERRRPQTVTLSVPQALRDHDRLVITGPPGSGKSTLLRWLALTFAEGKQALADRLGEAYPHDRLPVMVELRSFQGCFACERERLTTVNLADEIAAFVAEDARFEGTPAGFIRQALVNGDCLVVFDGLDEVAEIDARQRASSALQAFADNYGVRGNRVVVTCRTAGYKRVELGPGFQQCEINPFTLEDVSQFIHYWYEAAYPDDPATAREDAANLVKAVQGNDGVAKLAETPLLCTIIAIVYRRDGILPTRRADLYRKCCEALLDTWEQVKAIHQSGLIGGLDWQTKLDLLSPLAYWLHLQKGRTAAPEKEFEVRLAAELRQRGLGEEPMAEQNARDFLTAIRERSGLLQGRGDGMLEFPHLTLQEYLAARHIAAQPDPDYIDLVMLHLHEAWWREVHLLTIGHLGSGDDGAPKASKLLLAIIDRYRPPARLLRAIPCPYSEPSSPYYLLTLLVWWVSAWFKTLPARTLPRWQLIRRLAWAMQRERFFAAAALSDCAALRMMSEARDRIGAAMEELFRLAMAELRWTGLDTPWLAIVARSLGQMGQATPEVVAALVSALGDSYSDVRAEAVRSLGQLGQATPEMLAALVNALGDEWYVRAEAASSLDQLGQARPEVVAALVNALVTRDGLVLAEAVRSLGQLGQATPEVVAALVNTLGGNKWYARADAARSLGQLGQATPEIVKALVGALGSHDCGVPSAAARSLGQLGQATPDVVTALVSALEGSNRRVRAAAASSLGQLGHATPEVVTALVGTLGDSDWTAREEVARSLGQLGQATTEIVTSLVGALEDSDRHVRVAAAHSLIQLGHAPPEIVTAMVGALEDSDRHVRVAAARNLIQLGQTTPEVVASLVDALGDSDWTTREEAARSLVQLGQATPEAAAALVDCLRDDNWDAWEAAASSLRQLGQAPPEVVAALVGATGNSDSYVRQAAASSLGELGQATPEAVAALVGAMGDSDRYVREAAASSLGQLGQATPEVVAVLNRSLHDSSNSVLKAAHEALSNLFDGKPLPGDEWVPLRERQARSKRKLRRLLFILLALTMALVPLAYLLAALYVPWVRDNLWFLSLLLADVMAWVAFLANIGKIRETLGSLSQ